MTSDPRFMGSCTAWATYTVAQLAEMFAYENNSSVWQQVVAYRDTHDLLVQHTRELERAKKDLEAMWPPEKNEAARVFGGVVAELLTSMRHVGDAAVDNMTGLDNLAHSLANAKRDIDKLHEQWQQYQAQDKKDEVAGVPVKFWVEDPPDNWQEDLHRQAVARMYTMDTEVSQATERMTVPDEYKPLPVIDGGGVDPVDSPGGGSGSSRASCLMTPPYIPPPAPSPAGPTADSTGPGGAGLAGGAGPGSPPTVGAAAGSAGAVIGPVPGATAVAIGATAGFIGGAIASGAFGGGGPGAGGGRGTGGVLGPTRAAGGPKASGASAGGPRSTPLPPGGVIAGARGAGVPGQSGLAGAAGLPASGARRSGRSGRTFDPDNPWAVDEGGPAVIVPSPEPTHHDAGPGVIGLDR